MEQEELDKELVGIGSQPVPDLDLPTPGTSIPGIFSKRMTPSFAWAETLLGTFPFLQF